MSNDGVLSGLAAAVVGGDGRELEIIRGLLADGAMVRTCGCPPGAAALLGEPQLPSLAAAIDRADVVIAPVPLIAPDGTLYAPEWPTPLYLDDAAFAHARRGALLIIGTSTPQISRLAHEHGMAVREYGDDDELMILRAPTVAEGALGLTIAHTDISIHDARVLVIGCGRIGYTMTRVLLALGAHVTVVARNPVQRARAWELGALTLGLEGLGQAAAQAQMVFNTAPALLLTREILGSMAPDVFVLDMAGAPGGTDFTAAKELGITAVLGRGLGKRAPKTAGRSQWTGIRRIILQERPWHMDSGAQAENSAHDR